MNKSLKNINDEYASKKLSDLPDDLEEIDFSELQLTQLPDVQLFHAHKRLISIRFDINKISQVNARTFRGLENLVCISFSSNQISELNAGLFQGLHSLETIDFSLNQIRILHADIFRGLNKLRVIYFSCNQVAQLDAGTFKGLSSLEMIDFGSNKIAQLDWNTFQGLSNLKSVDFNANLLTKLDARMFQDQRGLKMLNFGSNQITHINPKLFEHLNCLTDLDFSSNRISHLNCRTFDGLTSLRIVNFESNQIAELDRSIFRCLKGLTDINFSSNQIIKLDEDIFYGLDKLVQIYFPSNKITRLDPNMFKDKRDLKWIDFSSNNIRNLHGDMFRGLANLQMINMSANQINELDVRLFNGLDWLISIDFSSNKIRNLHGNIFRGLENLQIINMSANQIKELDVRLFDDLQRLVSIDFSSNRIGTLHARTFEHANNLKRIDFNTNQLSELDGRIFKPLSCVESIDFSLNRIAHLDAHIFDDLTNLKVIIFASNKLTNIPGDLFSGRLQNLRQILFSSNFISHVPANLMTTLEQLEQANFKYDYSRLNSFSGLNDYISLFDLFFIVDEGNEYDSKIDTYHFRAKFKTNASFFEEFLNMYCLSTETLTFDFHDLKQNFSSQNKFKHYYGDAFTPLDFLLEMKSISNKAMTNLLKYGKYIIFDCYKFNIDQTDFQIRSIHSLNALCERNNRPLLDELKNLFYVENPVKCFQIAFEKNCETVACFLFDIFARKNNSQWPDNFLHQCSAKQWWTLFDQMLDFKQKHDQNNQPAAYYEMFENGFYTSDNASLYDNCDPVGVKRASSSHFLHFVASSKQTNLIRHSTTQEFIQLKWKVLPQLFYLINLAFFIVFILSYTIHLESVKHQSSACYLTSLILSVLMVFVFFVEEIIEFCASSVGEEKRKSTKLRNRLEEYFNTTQNRLELIIYSVCLVTLLVDLREMRKYIDPFMILCLYMILILRLEKFAHIGIYVTVFRRILKKSASVVPLVALASLAFLFSFRITSVRQNDDPKNENTFNRSLSFNFIQLMTFNLANFDNEKMGLGHHVNGSNWPIYIIYVLFLFILPILILNIFIGISVDELKKLLDDSQEYNMIIKIKYTLKMQDTLCVLRNGIFCRKIKLVDRLLDKLISYVMVKNKQGNNHNDQSNEHENELLLNVHDKSIKESDTEKDNSEQKISELNIDIEQLENRLIGNINDKFKNMKLQLGLLEEKIENKMCALQQMEKRLDNKLNENFKKLEQRSDASLNKILSSLENVTSLDSRKKSTQTQKK